MQRVFIVISDSDILLDNMKVFNHREDAQKYQLRLKEVPAYSDAVIHEKEVIE